MYYYVMHMKHSLVLKSQSISSVMMQNIFKNLGHYFAPSLSISIDGAVVANCEHSWNFECKMKVNYQSLYYSSS